MLLKKHELEYIRQEENRTHYVENYGVYFSPENNGVYISTLSKNPPIFCVLVDPDKSQNVKEGCHYTWAHTKKCF